MAQEASVGGTRVLKLAVRVLNIMNQLLWALLLLDLALDLFKSFQWSERRDIRFCPLLNHLSRDLIITTNQGVISVLSIVKYRSLRWMCLISFSHLRCLQFTYKVVPWSPERNRPIDLAVCGNLFGHHAVYENLLTVIDQLATNQRGARRIIPVGKRFHLCLGASPLRDQSLI